MLELCMIGRFSLLLGLLAVVTSATASEASPTLTLKRVHVRSIGPAPFDSGIVASWDRVTVETAEHQQVDLFSLHFSKDDVARLPKVGAVCDVTFHWGSLAGSSGDRLPRVGPWRQVDKFTCTRPG